MKHEQIGTVEITQLRIYPIDAYADMNSHETTTVVVDAGEYPVYRNMDAVYWMMTGRVNLRGSEKLGDGLYALHQGDARSPIEVRFPSAMYGPDEFAELLADPVCVDGPSQRLRFKLNQEARR